MPAPPNLPLDIPFTAPQVLATMEDTHVNVKVTPELNPLLAYSLAIPKTYAYSKQFGPVPTGPFATQGLGFFAGSAQPGAPVIAVTVTPIPFEIPIDTWARTTLTVEGWTVVSAKWFPGALGLFYDLVGTRVFNDVPEVRRTTVRVDGGNILAVNCLCSREHWDRAKEIIWAAHSTFELLGGTKGTRMEPWLAVKAENPDFEAAYPSSWSATPVDSPSEGISAVDFRLLDARQETLLAYLQVKAERIAEPDQPQPTRDELLAEALSSLVGAGFIPSAPPRLLSEEDDSRSVAVEGWQGGFLGHGHLGTADVTVRLGFIQRAEVKVSLSLLSPTTEDDTLTALRAQRAFEIVRATLRLD